MELLVCAKHNWKVFKQTNDGCFELIPNILSIGLRQEGRDANYVIAECKVEEIGLL